MGNAFRLADPERGAPYADFLLFGLRFVVGRVMAHRLPGRTYPSKDAGKCHNSRVVVCKGSNCFLIPQQGDSMSKGYWASIYREVKDPAKLAAYALLAAPAVVAAGGKFIVRGVADEVREQGLKERTVLIEFPTYEAAVAAYDSDAYKKALDALGDGAERDLRILRGVE
jgi:uncharacterized protein (DUF1330 family)